MIRFNNDYNKLCIPEILEAMTEIKNKAYAGYGLDEICFSAADKIRTAIGRDDADIHFLEGGTQTNVIFIAAALKPWESPVCADSGHINVHETGAPENTGHKVLTLPSVNGKINPEQIDRIAADYENSTIPEHVTVPKLVYISQPTEFGTIYSKKEISGIYSTCKKHGMYLYIDGARLAYALSSEENDATLEDIANSCDAFYIGGTKCGAMLGEALIILNDEIKPHFRNAIKQNNGMMAKGWVIGIQFDTLFTDGLYTRYAGNAVKYAMAIKDAFEEKGIKTYIDSPTNQQFVAVTDEQADKLAEKFIYEDEGRTEDGRRIIRFCTDWHTNEEEIKALTDFIAGI